MKKILCVVLSLSMLFSLPLFVSAEEKSDGKSYIKWVDFDVSAKAMGDCLDVCTLLYNEGKECSFSQLLACLGAKYGGNFSLYKKADLEEIAGEYKNGTALGDTVSNKKLFDYYTEAYDAVLGGLVGEYTEFCDDGAGNVTSEKKYGLRAYSPIASGYYYNHFDDFGASRSFGYKRSHLGHDLMGSVGTPVIAVESGYVEACGWNMYGGWRIGIRSFDGKRYYYYAHLRKNHPYNDIYEGKQVMAGEVIGYLGMTGYSNKENTNNINTPHLHYGLEVIFDASQKDGWNQIWVDMYALTEFLYRNRAEVYECNGEKNSKRRSIPTEYPD